MKLQPAVKKQTSNIAIATAAGTGVMLIVFFILHRIFPEQIPFDYRVVLGGLGGCAIAVLNFFLMAVTVQKVTNLTDEDMAKRQMAASLRYRMLMQAGWIILAIVLPCFQWAAGIIPLLIPGVVIKPMAAAENRKAAQKPEKAEGTFQKTPAAEEPGSSSADGGKEV